MYGGGNVTTRQLQPSDITVACHVRAPLVLDPVDSKVETLKRCEREGKIDALMLRSWPAEVTLSNDSSYREVVDRFRQFEQWAERQDVSVRPPFRIRSSTSLATDEHTDVLVTPTISLALYHDDRLVGVFPHTDGETTYTVPDAIADLSTGALPTPIEEMIDATVEVDEPVDEEGNETAPSKRTRDAREAPAECPECGAPSINVQGIETCANCGWVRPYSRERKPEASAVL